MIEQPLSREEVCAVIAGRGAARRVPLNTHMWVHAEAFGEREAAVRDILARYPEDIQIVGLRMPDVYRAPEDDPEYRWVNYDDPGASAGGIDAQVAITDWAQLDGILRDFPNPQSRHLTAHNPPADGRYRLGSWWYCLFERHWSLRGMENALMDFYTDPDQVKRLYAALTDFYLVAMERGKRELQLDGIFTSDDLGAQSGPMFSPEILEEFFKPCYRRLCDKAHELGMHFWLHACGNIEPFISHFIDVGLDVLHPIQKYTMDEQTIVQRYGDRICFWAGMDVQQTIPWGTADDVRREVRFLIDTYQRRGGRLVIGAGNGINQDCPLTSLEAFFAEAVQYGARSR